MPNIEGIGLQNFRTIKDLEYLELAPITLITGANNTGKSSILKAIQLLTNSFEDGLIRDQLVFRKMKHELGGIGRTINQDRTKKIVKKNKKSSNFGEYNFPLDEQKKGKNTVEKPIFHSDNDLAFVFPLEIGGKKNIKAKLELRFEIWGQGINMGHSLRSIAVLLNSQYLMWSNINGYQPPDYDAPYWNVNTSLDLKVFLSLLLQNSDSKKEQKYLEPNKKIEHYFSIDLFQRVKTYGLEFDFPIKHNIKDDYKDIIKLLQEGEYLFGNYKNLNNEKKKAFHELEKKLFNTLILGKNNMPSVLTDVFKLRDVIDWGESYRLIHSFDNKGKEKATPFLYNFNNSPNATNYFKLLDAISNDLTKGLKDKISRYNRVYFLPPTRGKGREWFIDEQEGDSIILLKDFSNVYKDSNISISDFFNFWIGEGIVKEKNGRQSKKGFKIGQGIEIERTEDIGLTKVFLKTFDGNKIPIVDLGYGVSQLLPILMKILIIANKQIQHIEIDFENNEGYYRDETYYFSPSTLLIEEPEANLHPALQSKLAEMFIDAGTRFNIQFIIETHSEYLIYKLQEYIGRKIISPEDIAMYYLNHPDTLKTDSSKQYINRVEIKDDGSIDYEAYFGKGFFDEQISLKLSLLNIQRDRFIELFKKTKEKFVADSTGISEEEQFKKLTNLLDEHFEKLDYSTYINRVESQFPSHQKLQDNTKRYLSAAYHLMEIYHSDTGITDYAPAVIQLGRAVECEFMFLFKSAKDYLLSLPNYSERWHSDFQNEMISISISDNFEFRNYIKKTGAKLYRISFGEIKNVLTLMESNPLAKLNQVKLLREFNDYLESQFFNNWVEVKNNIPDLQLLVNRRNEAAHTYGENEMSQQSAVELKEIVERLLRVWSKEMR